MGLIYKKFPSISSLPLLLLFYLPSLPSSLLFPFPFFLCFLCRCALEIIIGTSADTKRVKLQISSFLAFFSVLERCRPVIYRLFYRLFSSYVTIIRILLRILLLTFFQAGRGDTSWDRLHVETIGMTVKRGMKIEEREGGNEGRIIEEGKKERIREIFVVHSPEDLSITIFRYVYSAFSYYFRLEKLFTKNNKWKLI